MKKQDKEIWYGCRNCSYVPPADKKQSNENWQVYKPGKCPKCGEEMNFNIGNKPSING
jgi:Zn finger protein HypA/HybF involved in hydrogenase expression